jgi:hypothetical protein
MRPWLEAARDLHISRQACNWFPQTCHWTLVGRNQIPKTWHSAGKESPPHPLRPLYEGPRSIIVFIRDPVLSHSGPVEILTCSFSSQINFNSIFSQPVLTSFPLRRRKCFVNFSFPSYVLFLVRSAFFFVSIRSRDSSVSIVSRLRAIRPRNRSSIPDKCNRFFWKVWFSRL